MSLYHCSESALRPSEIDSLPVGGQVLYEEDGQQFLCKIVKNNTTQRDYKFTLEVLEIKRSHPNYEDPTIGEQFEVFGDKGCPCYWGWAFFHAS
jgi:hypothetical protein